MIVGTSKNSFSVMCTKIARCFLSRLDLFCPSPYLGWHMKGLVLYNLHATNKKLNRERCYVQCMSTIHRYAARRGEYMHTAHAKPPPFSTSTAHAHKFKLCILSSGILTTISFQPESISCLL